MTDARPHPQEADAAAVRAALDQRSDVWDRLWLLLGSHASEGKRQNHQIVRDHLTALEAEVERLNRIAGDNFSEAESRIHALTQKNAALRQDAGRMDYLQLHQSVRTRDAKGRHWWRVSAWSSGAPTLRAAIDDLRAALSSSAPTPGGSNE